MKNIIHNNRKTIGLEVVRSKKKHRVKKLAENISPLKGKIFHDMSELELISNKIHENQYKIYFNLLYKASIDNDRAFTFHKKCDPSQTTLVLLDVDLGDSRKEHGRGAMWKKPITKHFYSR